jgi:hypothetical protein
MSASRLRVWSPARVAALLIAALALVAGLTLTSTRAWAVLVALPENGTPGHLALRSDPSPAQFLDMSPGTADHWEIATDLVDPAATLTMQFTRDGALVSRPDGLTVQAQLCDGEWTGMPTAPACATGATNVFGPVAASDTSTFGALSANHTGAVTGPTWSLGTLTSAHDEYLLVTLSIPDTPAARADPTLMGLTADIGFGFDATETTVPSGPTTPATPITPAAPAPSALASTGVDALALLLLALGALGLGIVLWSARRVRAGLERSAA